LLSADNKEVAMDRELAEALALLGLSAAEAEIYVALLQHGTTGPVSAYKLAQTMGRDPANTTKVLSAMSKRGAVRVSGRRPCLYAAVSPEDFTGRLVANVRAKQQLAVQLLREIGEPTRDEHVHPLTSRAEVMDTVHRLLGEAERVVLLDAAGELVNELAADLTAAATGRDATVLVKSTATMDIPRVQIRCDQQELAPARAPGPWLRLAIDATSCLEALLHPAGGDDVLFGQWSRCPTHVFLVHRNLATEMALADLLELLHGGTGGDLARRRTSERAAVVGRLATWRERWREAGWPAYEPLRDAATGAPSATGSEAASEPETAAEAVAEAQAGADTDDSLQFIYRKRRRS
jgi:sugar-specific transcriptional regulator TrmB